MGWASGSQLANEIWRAVRKYIPVSNRRKVATELVNAFENEDCDTLDAECPQLMKDAGLSNRWAADE